MNTTLCRAAAFSFAGVSLLSACRSKENAAPAGDTSAANAAAGSLEGPTQSSSAAQASADSGMQTKMSGMPGMSGAMGGMMSAAMMDSMQTHMGMMEGRTADRMKAMLPAHRQMVANMLAQMNADMRRMNMQSEPKWTALADSVRRDLVRMPEMSAAELRSAMPAHAARMMRLMAMHRSMMDGTKK